jgi:hypothetical protein
LLLEGRQVEKWGWQPTLSAPMAHTHH